MLHYVPWKSAESFGHIWHFATPWTSACQDTLSGDFPGKNTGVGCHSFLQGIFLNQESNLGLLHCRQILYYVSHQRNLYLKRKWKVKVQGTQSCPTLCNPMHYTVHGILQARILGWVAFPFSRGSPGIEPRFPTLQADSLAAEPQGKPKNTGVDSLSLLQGIFPTQESNQGLLHCRRILYQLSYQGTSKR